MLCCHSLSEEKEYKKKVLKKSISRKKCIKKKYFSGQKNFGSRLRRSHFIALWTYHTSHLIRLQLFLYIFSGYNLYFDISVQIYFCFLNFALSRFLIGTSALSRHIDHLWKRSDRFLGEGAVHGGGGGAGCLSFSWYFIKIYVYLKSYNHSSK